MKFITGSLLTLATVLARPVFAQATIDDAADCIRNLVSSHSERGANADLRDVATDKLDAWLRAELLQVAPERRERIVDEIVRAKVDPHGAGRHAAFYDASARQLYVRERGFDKITGFVTLVRQLDHLIGDLDSPIAHWESRAVVRLLGPRSQVFVNQARALRAEYRFLTSIFETMSPESIYDAMFEARGVSSENRALLAKLLKAVHVDGGEVRVELTDDLAAEIETTFDGSTLALHALLREIQNEDLGTLVSVERASENRFVMSALWRRYKGWIAGEYAVKTSVYGVFATAILSLLR